MSISKGSTQIFWVLAWAFLNSPSQALGARRRAPFQPQRLRAPASRSIAQHSSVGFRRTVAGARNLCANGKRAYFQLAFSSKLQAPPQEAAIPNIHFTSIRKRKHASRPEELVRRRDRSLADWAVVRTAQLQRGGRQRILRRVSAQLYHALVAAGGVAAGQEDSGTGRRHANDTESGAAGCFLAGGGDATESRHDFLYG
jgi:hypothetical protein